MTSYSELRRMMDLITQDYQRRGGYPRQYGRRIDYPHTYVAYHYGTYNGYLDEEHYYEREQFVRQKLNEIESQHKRLGLSREQFSAVRQFTIALLRGTFLGQLRQLRSGQRLPQLKPPPVRRRLKPRSSIAEFVEKEYGVVIDADDR